jgi:hypothetical protein
MFALSVAERSRPRPDRSIAGYVGNGPPVNCIPARIVARRWPRNLRHIFYLGSGRCFLLA